MSNLESQLVTALAQIVNGAGQSTTAYTSDTRPVCLVPTSLVEQARDLLTEYQCQPEWRDWLNTDTVKEVNRASNRVF